MLQQLLTSFGTPTDFREFFLRLLVCAILCFCASALCVAVGERPGATMRLARVLPLVGLTMTLVTAVVASSLALAIGMVGALSIVRYRLLLPPEGLVFLFLAIAMGIASGIGQIAAAVLALAMVAGALGLRKWVWKKQVVLRVRIAGLPGLVTPLLGELGAAFPQLEFRHSHQSPQHAEWTLRYTPKVPGDLLVLREWLLARAATLEITFEHEQAAA